MSLLSVDRRRDNFKPKTDRILSGRFPRVEVRDLDITGGKSILCNRHKTRTAPRRSFIYGIYNNPAAKCILPKSYLVHVKKSVAQPVLVNQWKRTQTKSAAGEI